VIIYMRKIKPSLLERTTFVIASLAAFAGGCATSGKLKYEASPMPDIPVERCTYRATLDNVGINATFLDPAYESSIFNSRAGRLKNLANEGKKPLYLRFENPKDEELFLNTAATEFFDEFGRKWEYISPQEAARRPDTKERRLRETAAFLISPIGAAMASRDLAEVDRDRETDYTEKSFEPRHRIGNSDRGFIFLKNEDGASDNSVSRERGKIRLYIERDGLPQEVILIRESSQ
jgi:hypothetical protein